METVEKWISETGDAPMLGVAVFSLRSRLESVLDQLPKAAHHADEDDEYVHQLRVWSRRAGVAIDMYRDLLPEWRAVWIEEQLARIRKATNDARDADVFSHRLMHDSTPGAKQLLKRVQRHRAESQKRILALEKRLQRDRGRFERRVEKLLKRVRFRGKRRKQPEPTYREWACEQLPGRLESFLKMANFDFHNTKRMHQFRIEGKRLRYALELLFGAIASESRDTALSLLKQLQDRLGEVNDHASAVRQMQHWMEDNAGSKEKSYLKELISGERDKLAASQDRFHAWWTPKKREQLQEAFQSVLNSLQHAAV